MATSAPDVRWRNRIVRYGEAEPEQLVGNPFNFRVHPRDQELALRGVLNEVGWVQNVVVNERTGFVVDGHLRVLLAISEGETRVPVTFVDLDPEEEAKILATLDPIAAMAGTDRDKLNDLLGGIKTRDAGLSSLLQALALRSNAPLNMGGDGENGSVTVGVGGGAEFTAPHDKPQTEPRLDADILIEVRCTRAGYLEIEDTIAEIGEMDGCEVSIV